MAYNRDGYKYSPSNGGRGSNGNGSYDVHEVFDHVGTFREDESVRVQVITLVNSYGKSDRVEIRKWVSNERYEGRTKEAFSFTDPDAIDALIHDLTAAKAILEGLISPTPAPKQVTGKRAPRKVSATSSASNGGTKAPTRRRKTVS